MNQLLKILLNLFFILIKVLVLIIIVIMLVILTALPSDAQSAKSKKTQKELTVFARIKDHLTHLDIDSTVTARLLSASDSSFIDSMKVNKMYYEGKTYCYAQTKIYQPGKYLMYFDTNGYEPKYVNFDILKMYRNEVTKELKPVYLRKKPKKLEMTLDEVVVTATGTATYLPTSTSRYAKARNGE